MVCSTLCEWEIWSLCASPLFSMSFSKSSDSVCVFGISLCLTFNVIQPNRFLVIDDRVYMLLLLRYFVRMKNQFSSLKMFTTKNSGVEILHYRMREYKRSNNNSTRDTCKTIQFKVKSIWNKREATINEQTILYAWCSENDVVSKNHSIHNTKANSVSIWKHRQYTSICAYTCFGEYIVKCTNNIHAYNRFKYIQKTLRMFDCMSLRFSCSA